MNSAVEQDNTAPEIARQPLLETSRHASHACSIDLASIQQSYITLFQSGAVVSALLAANAINLLILFKDKDTFSGIPAGVCPPSLLNLAYISIVINTFATVYPLVGTAMIIDIAYKCSCEGCRLQELIPTRGWMNANSLQILKMFGAPWDFPFYCIYWAVLFLSGLIITVIEISLFVATVEVRQIGITLSIVIVIVCLPLCWYILRK
ncbi:hypothetical protein PTI98_009277 [Pleurotus ostreatus]|nr:hypothetical protein PTI98_009277 [Pleurotus ostreatus]